MVQSKGAKTLKRFTGQAAQQPLKQNDRKKGYKVARPQQECEPEHQTNIVTGRRSSKPHEEPPPET